MASPKLLEQNCLRIAVEGCGHGTLHSIYASVQKSCELKGWRGVDLLIIGGDFQAVRNALDLKAVSMPKKYYDMHDFHEYYSGTRIAPYLTIFVGGNHEASNYMWELYYGGWAAPNIYYMGAANVIRLGPLRIAGLSGIWKGYNYNKPHFERLPYNSDDIKSIYHVRELDVRKLLQIRSQVDIGISHDWPRGMEWKGNFRQLFKFKPHLEQDANNGTLGSIAAKDVLNRLRPAYWFSAHLHAKYAAVWEHDTARRAAPQPIAAVNATMVTNESEIELDLDTDDPAPAPNPKNDAEIDLDLGDDNGLQGPTRTSKGAIMDAGLSDDANGKFEEVPKDIRDLLPESFARRPDHVSPSTLPFPEDITNKSTKFLALDKCLPNRHFLQLLEISPDASAEFQRPLKLEYDKEWLAITRVFANDLQLGDPDTRVSEDKGDAFYRPLIEREMEWVDVNIVKPGKTVILADFAQTAPVYDPTTGIHVHGQPQEYTNPHTQAFCDLLQIRNAFHASDDERAQMIQAGPRPEQERFDRGGGNRGGFRSGNRSRGQTRGRGRGGGRGGRGHTPNFGGGGGRGWGRGSRW